MNLFEKIKILLKVNNAVNQLEEDYKMDTTATKPGWKTTEFWGKVAIQLFTIWGALKGVVAPEKAALITGVLEAIYGLARSLVKIKGTTLPDVPAV